MNRYMINFRFIVLFTGILLSSAAHSGKFYSKSSGGLWNAGSTWEGNMVPGITDTIYITAGNPVILNINTSCNAITVNSSGVLLYDGSGSRTLIVNYFVINNGTIKNGTGLLEMTVYGDITFNGLEWSNNKVTIAGSTTRSLTFASEKIFTGATFLVSGATPLINATSNLSFLNTSVDFNNSTVNLTPNTRVTINGQYLTRVILAGSTNDLELTGGAYISNAAINGTTFNLYGNIKIASNTVTFNSSIILTPESKLENLGTSHTVYINGSITNNGFVINTSNNLTVHITGNIEQYGTWNIYETQLTGTSSQEITLGSGKIFSGTNFYVKNITTNPEDKSIIAHSDLEFRGLTVNFAYGSPGEVTGGKVILPNKKCLKFSGEDADKALLKVIIASSGSEASLWLLRGGYLGDFSNTCATLNLKGLIRVGSNNNSLSGNVVILDTLTNYGGSGHVLYVNGTFRNLGYIMNNAVNLEIQVTGDVYHYGMEWSNYRVQLTGTSEQNIYFAPFSKFTGAYFESNNTHELASNTNLTFEGTSITLFYSTLTFTGGQTLSITGSAAKIVNATINGDITLTLNDGAYPGTVTFNGTVTLTGNSRIFNSVVYCNGAVTNTGTLQNHNLSDHTLYLNSDFINSDTVQNGSGMGNFTFEIKGDLINDGIWTNHENRVIGSNDSSQNIRLNQDKAINAKVVLYSNLGGSNFRWYKNDQVIGGQTGTTLIFNQITTNEYGRYHCTSTAGQSRTITIAQLMTVDFNADPLSGCHPLTVNFVDNSISGYPIQHWHWEFGDDSESSSQNPSHQYTGYDAFDVTLTISDGYVTKSETKSGYISTNQTPIPDFSTTDCNIGIQSVFTDLTEGILYDIINDTLYASTVIAYSSQYTSTDWSAQQILGIPNVYPLHKDDIRAWASATENGQREWIELRYASSRHINKVIIYETLYPGTVDTVYVKNPTTLLWEMVWSGTASIQPKVGRAFAVSFETTPYETNEIRIALNSPAVTYWNEIDAVAIVSPVSSNVSSNTTYLWDVDENSQTFTTKGDINYTYQTPGIHHVSLTITNNAECQATKHMDVTITAPVTTTWTGSVNNNWNNTSNWSPACIPYQTTSVDIPVVANFPTISSSATCHNLTLRDGASLLGNENLTISGTVNIHRNITGNWAGGAPTPSTIIHHVSSPTTSGRAGIFSGGLLSTYNEVTQNWDAITDPWAPLQPGTGFVTAMPEDGELLFTGGSPNSEDINYENLSYTPGGNASYVGWHLLGNPFPSSLDWEEAEWQRVNVDAAVYLWTGSQYKCWITPPGLPGYGTLPNGNIPVGQGFMVHVSSGTNTLTIPTEARIHANQDLFKSGVTDLLKLSISGNGYEDQALIHFTSDATAGFDPGFDAYKLSGIPDAPKLSVLRDSTRYAADALPVDSKQSVIAIGLKVGKEANYSLAFDGLTSFAAGTELLLEDLLLNKTVDANDLTTYQFQAKPDDQEHRFNLHFHLVGLNNLKPDTVRIYSIDKNILINIPFEFTGKVSVFTMLGVEVINKLITAPGQSRISMNVVEGYYVVKVFGEKGVWTKKVYVK